MTVAKFRRVALNMPQAIESEHMDHPDFRVKGKIFATLFHRDGVDWGMVKLTPAQQRRFIKARPDVFEPIKGYWGRLGCTKVHLDRSDIATLREAIDTAWRNTAPKRLGDSQNPISPSG